jgi:hypothetical protein
MSVTTEEAERLAERLAHDAEAPNGARYQPYTDSAMRNAAAALRSLAADRDALRQERDALQAENARLREALTNAAAVIGSFYAFAETADAVSISGIARCHAMLTSMKKNRRRIEETVMQPARAELGEKE